MLKNQFFFLFSFLSTISIISSFICEENKKHCLKCNPVTNLCLKCDLDIYAPDSEGGCSNANHCEAGKNYCNECNSKETLCETCELGLFPDQSGGCSYTDNCLLSYKGECLECIDDFILIGNLEEENGFKFCKSKSSEDFKNCKEINVTTGYCEICEDDFFSNLGDKRCIKTENCYYSKFGICSECNPGFYLNKKEEKCFRKESPFALCKITLDGENCEECDDDVFMAEDGKCVDSNFCSLSYNTKYSCKECIKNYYLTQDKRACSNEKNCKNADKETGLCEICLEGYYLTKMRKCESNTEDNSFKYCKNADEEHCIECLWGFYLAGDNQCTPSPNCTESSGGICVVCDDGYFLGKDNICTTVEHCARSDYFKNCVECEENYYFDLSDRTCKEAKGQLSNCLESNMEGDRCNICRSNYYISLVDYLCYSNEEKGPFYKCKMSTMDGTKCLQCIEGFYSGLKDFKCTDTYVCLYSDDDHVCQECRDDYCLNKKNKKCYLNYEFNNEEGGNIYYKCLSTNKEGNACEKCTGNYNVGESGLCINLKDCEEKENESCNKCQIRDYEDNLLCANKYYGCVETLAENCLRCDDSYFLYSCTQCAEGYILNDIDECVKK